MARISVAFAKYCLFVLCCVVSTSIFSQTQTDPLVGRPHEAGEDRELSVEEVPVVIDKMKAESPDTRDHTIGLISEAYSENPGNPALKLDRMWVNSQGAVVELSGLARKGNKYSAIMDVASLYLLDLNAKTKSRFLLHVGGQVVEDPSGKRLVHVVPGGRLYLFFESINDLNPHSMRYLSWTGAEDRYFDRIDPLFGRRYDQSFQSATAVDASVEDMKKFLLEFASNDPEKRAQNVFVNLIKKLRMQQTFDGYLQAYKLVKDPADEQMANKMARTQDEREKLNAAVSVVRAAEAAKREELNRALDARQAELRRRDEARQAESRKQEQMQIEQKRQASVADAEVRCMRTPSCRRAWEVEQAKCSGQIASCRGGCDRMTGANGGYSSFFANLTASILARTCYAGCKCGSGFAALLGKAGVVLADGATSATEEPRKDSRAAEHMDGKNGKGTRSSSVAGPSTTERLRAYWDGDVQHIFVRCAGTGKERNYTFNRNSGRFCTPGYSSSCETEEWVQRAVCR